MSNCKFKSSAGRPNSVNLYDFIPAGCSFDFQIMFDDTINSEQFHNTPTTRGKYSPVKVLSFPRNPNFLEGFNLYSDPQNLAKAILISKARFARFKISLVMPSMFLREVSSDHWTNWLHPPIMQEAYWHENLNQFHYAVNNAVNVFVIWVTMLDEERFNPPLITYSVNIAIAFVTRERVKLKICIPHGDEMRETPYYSSCKELKTRGVVPMIFKFVRNPKTFYYKGKSINFALISSQKLINPFKSRETKKSEEIFAQIIGRHGNVSFLPYDYYNSTNPAIQIGKFTVFDRSLRITIKFTGWEFLSCYRESRIDFRFCITPFQPALWVSLAVSVALIVWVTVLVLYSTGMYEVAFSPWLFMLATLFEETIPIPGQLEKLSWLRMIITSWCLMSVILTNCYNGLMITELNAPFRSYSKETFPDLSCGQDYKDGVTSNYDFVNKVVPYYEAITRYVQNVEDGNITGLEMVLKHANSVKENWFSLLSHLAEGKHLIMPEFLLHLNENTPLNRVTENLQDPNPRPVGNVLSSFDLSEVGNLNLLRPTHAHFPRSFRKATHHHSSYSDFQKLVESEIISCGKSAFIARSENLAAEFEFLSKNYLWIKFTKGIQVREPDAFGLLFDGEFASRVPRYYKILVESGIYNRIKEEMRVRKFSERKAVSGRKDENLTMELDGGILTVFVICGVVLVGAMGTFLAEFWKPICLILITFVRHRSRRISQAWLNKNQNPPLRKAFGKL
ncbi:hypothetical protein Fcan01_23045 [Folsomia candida]|uniref:Uncharacterized protein n=1 Tax=Folsomia candida TaxID=158441 RepID=A0A226DAU6_FOLCA|nr:hypothetical protein Fcan01_23045 [Folsomia candida]